MTEHPDLLKIMLSHFSSEMWADLSIIQRNLERFRVIWPEKPQTTDPRWSQFEIEFDDICDEVDTDMSNLIAKHKRFDLLPVWKAIHLTRNMNIPTVVFSMPDGSVKTMPVSEVLPLFQRIQSAGNPQWSPVPETTYEQFPELRLFRDCVSAVATDGSHLHELLIALTHGPVQSRAN